MRYPMQADWSEVASLTGTLQGGGAINMGLDDFKGSGTCSVARPNATSVLVNGSSVFAGNVAKLQGGAIALQSGSLLLQVNHMWWLPGECGARLQIRKWCDQAWTFYRGFQDFICTLQGVVIANNSALGQAGGGATGSGLGGGLFLQPACQGGAGCRAAFALLNGTLLDANNATQVSRFITAHHL